MSLLNMYGRSPVRLSNTYTYVPVDAPIWRPPTHTPVWSLVEKVRFPPTPAADGWIEGGLDGPCPPPHFPPNHYKLGMKSLTRLPP